jgi:GT2 family glycosyltransferase
LMATEPSRSTSPASSRSDFSFASFILTYDRPGPLETTLETMLAQTRSPDLLMVVDNGTSDRTESVVRSFADRGVGYLHTGDNLGPAGGFAYGMEWAASRGYDWAHCVDDDDPPRTLDTVERLRALIERQDDGSLGAVGAAGSRWNWRIGHYQRVPDEELHGDLSVDTISWGGQLSVRREVIETMGAPEKELFFGFEELLYCLALGRAGWRLMIDGDLTREYRIRAGRMDLRRPRSWRPRDHRHALWRRYYTTRNYIHYMRHHLDRPDLARRGAARALAQAASSWARGPAYGAHYTALQVRGVLDGYRGRLGRTVEPVAKPGG